MSPGWYIDFSAVWMNNMVVETSNYVTVWHYVQYFIFFPTLSQRTFNCCSLYQMIDWLLLFYTILLLYCAWSILNVFLLLSYWVNLLMFTTVNEEIYWMKARTLRFPSPETLMLTIWTHTTIMIFRRTLEDTIQTIIYRYDVQRWPVHRQSTLLHDVSNNNWGVAGVDVHKHLFPEISEVDNKV